MKINKWFIAVANNDQVFIFLILWVIILKQVQPCHPTFIPIRSNPNLSSLKLIREEKQYIGGGGTSKIIQIEELFSS